ncbi:hypothetical protein DIPPA_18365 [Diplonema papillatum]|nr:hypothetical protein DIPPA_18365 [Diplonema papillatum]
MILVQAAACSSKDKVLLPEAHGCTSGESPARLFLRMDPCRALCTGVVDVPKASSPSPPASVSANSSPSCPLETNSDRSSSVPSWQDRRPRRTKEVSGSFSKWM